jgi:PAS domain S-box-containing protein
MQGGDDPAGIEGALGPPVIRLALENWPAGAVLIDQEGRITAANRAAAKLFGYRLRDLRQVSLTKLIPDWCPLDGGESAKPNNTRRRAKGQRSDGTFFQLRFSQLLVEADGALWTLVSIRARSRQSIARDNVGSPDSNSQEERLHAAVKAGRIGTWVWDLRNRTVWWDDAMYELWGQGRQEQVLSVSDAASFVHPDDQQWAGAETVAFLKSDATEFSQELRLVRPNQAMRWIAVSGRIERDEQGRGVRLIGATMDVTACKQAEETLRHAQKIEALGTLAGGIAHDFNNILLAIAGNTRLAISDLPSDHPVQRGLIEIGKASARASDLVNRILTFSRQGESRRQVIALPPAVEEAVKLLRATLPAMIHIRCEFAAGLPYVRADATQIHQIVVNLITNSAHAIGDEAAGIISVELDAVTLAQSEIVTPELAAGRYVRLTVSDTGCGMDKETLDRVFDPFFTTKPVGRGTGLGLSVVHGIMRNHEGAILATSELGRGTLFRLYFPALDLPAADVAKPVATISPECRGEGRRVMYIDDEESLVFLMSRVLERSGYQVTGFSDPDLALQVLQQRASEFDVVVTDLSMPGMSGFHVARAIAEIRADLPTVVTSGYVRAEDREVARHIGVRELVLKPNTVEELAQVLERVFEKG